MIPIQKLASLLIRTFSKPLSNQIKRYALNKHRSRKPSLVKTAFVFLGNKYHNVETFINRKSIGIKSQEMFFKPLTDEAALNKGSDFFADIFVYACILGIPLLELYKSQRDSAKKSQEQDTALQNYQTQIDNLKQLNDQFQIEYNRIVAENQYIEQSLKHFEKDIDDQVQHLQKQLKS
ncbi:unnamed protein product [Paramecium primaurelia]|uniref:OPA3-like protein n=1 Tax=Paramecium primaurelia TaxID=5886 RepID=A0A8S1QFU6_PARPR|nr:unnamed protein product [Paramecium primaurelia]